MLNNKKNKYFQVAQGVWGMKLVFVNIYMIANRRGSGNGWVLVDAGLKGSAKRIIEMAESLFGPGSRPKAIILTHGHFDHIGALEELLIHWDVPVYAHALEIPYLTGLSSYPPADPLVGGGLMSLLSVFYPTSPIALGNRIKAINMYSGIHELQEWKVIHTPGHSPGHISLFLPLNTTLIAGDALTTTQTESAIYILNYIKKLSGPPKYFTTDWFAAENSVRTLVALQPRIVSSGHGQVLRGKELQFDLDNLLSNFEEDSIPASGRYVKQPAVADEYGVKFIPPFKSGFQLKIAISITAALITFLVMRNI